MGPRREKKSAEAPGRLGRPAEAPELWISAKRGPPGARRVLQRRALALQRASNKGQKRRSGGQNRPDRCFRSSPSRDRPLPSKRETVRTSRTYEHQAVGKQMSMSQRIEAVRPLRRVLPAVAVAAVVTAESAGQPASTPFPQIAHTDGRR